MRPGNLQLRHPAVAAGLLRYALNPGRHLSLRGRFCEDAGSYLLKVGKWIKEASDPIGLESLRNLENSQAW